MKIYTPKILKLFPKILFVIIISSFSSFAATDPNPNSPTPILLNAFDSKSSHEFPQKNKTLKKDSKVVLYLANIRLLQGEGETAFRVYVSDSPDTWQTFFLY